MSRINVLSVRRRQVTLVFACLLLCVGCQRTFIVRAEPTSNFPRPWSEPTQPSTKKAVRLEVKRESPATKTAQKG